MSTSPGVATPQKDQEISQGYSETSEPDESLPRKTLNGECLLPENESRMKVRKPYTITKQRERWTENEHHKFLEALKLYGRAWRHIEEHVGTKTAVQIRSHAQKFFCKIKKESSLGVSKEAIEDFDIPPPRPKRKPIHPYPRKCAAVIPCNDKVPRPKSESKPDLLGIRDRDSVSSVPPAVDDDPCQQRRADDNASAGKSHQNLQEMHSESSQNSDPAIEVAKELQNLSGLVFDGSTKATEDKLSPVKEMLPDQPDNGTNDNNNMTSEMSSSNLVAAFQQLIAPLQPFMHCTNSSEKCSPFQSSSSAAQNLMQNSLSPSQVPNMDGAPALPTLASPCSSYMPWHLAHAAPFNNPIAFAAAAAAAAAFWPGLPQQSSLHVPLRPSLNLEAQNGSESTNAVAAAAVAAAAAAFANASTWWSLNGAVANPPVTPKVRSVYKPNPTVQPTTIEGQQTSWSCLPHNPRSQEKDCKPVSGEQEDSTVNGSLEDVHSDYPDSQDWTVANSRPSPEHGEVNCTQAKLDMSTETNEKNRITEVLSVTASEGKMKQASSGLATTEDGEEGSSQTGYSSPVEANAPTQWVASRVDEPCGSAHLVKCETSSEQDAFRITFLVTVTGDASQDKQELDMIKQSMSGNTRKLHEENKDLQVNHDKMERLSGHARKLLEGSNDLLMKHDNMWGQSLQQETSDEVSYSAERKKVAENGNLLAAHETADTFSVTQGENHVADSSSEAASSKHREKLVVTAHSELWKVAGNKSKLLSSSQKSQLHGEYRDRIRTCKLDQQNLEKRAEGSPFKTQRLCDPVASSSGSSRYSGQGFVPYRRS